MRVGVLVWSLTTKKIYCRSKITRQSKIKNVLSNQKILPVSTGTVQVRSTKYEVQKYYILHVIYILLLLLLLLISITITITIIFYIIIIFFPC
jgi:hypothetical protein